MSSVPLKKFTDIDAGLFLSVLNSLIMNHNNLAVLLESDMTLLRNGIFIVLSDKLIT